MYDKMSYANKDVRDAFETIHKYNTPTGKAQKLVITEYYIYYNNEFITVWATPWSNIAPPIVYNLGIFSKNAIEVNCEYKCELGFDELHLTDK